MNAVATLLALAGMIGGLWFLVEHVVVGSIRQGIRNAQRRGRLVRHAQAREARIRARGGFNGAAPSARAVGETTGTVYEGESA
ncbi:hypothetical protein ACFOYW_15340 [Gryllotalpicola reticulitermitis]|uniref:Uncharacterized protein n=1 Tax=Gryllotalpicola reticulitermitis TaxID=1184153 RepID=A0ABV8Q8Q9_9MICO